MPQRSEWIRSRRQILRQIKKQIRLILGEESSELSRYRVEYEREFWRKATPVKKSHLLSELSSASLILMGDFHAFHGSQKGHVRLLSEIAKTRKPILVVEFLSSRHQRSIDSFIQGSIDETEFLELVQWEQNWGFPWSHYSEIMSLARKGKWKVYGIDQGEGDSPSELIRKDEHTAELLFHLREKHASDSPLVLIIGESHLARNHLPLLLKARPETKDPTIILQNSDKIYFDLAEKNIDHEIEVVRLRPRVYCVMESPPWIKWQSYLIYLEQNFDSDIDDHDRLDYTDHVADLVRIASRDLSYDEIAENNFAVYTVDFAVPPALAKYARYLRLRGRSYMIPKSGKMYLARSTINHAATLAGYYIHSSLCGLSKPPWSNPKNFLPLIWHEAVAFFISKLNNPKRRPSQFRALRADLQLSVGEGWTKQAFQLALDQRLSELSWIRNKRKRRWTKRPRSWQIYIEAARVLGSMLGERLFLAYRKNRLAPKLVIKWLKTPMDSTHFEEKYFNILDQLDQLDSQNGEGQWPNGIGLSQDEPKVP